MEKNSSSEKSQQFTGKDVNDNANQKKNQYVQNEGNENPFSKYNSSGNTGLGKGTGLSNEANSSQTEESWQGTGGSMANETQRKNMGEKNDDQDSKNYSKQNSVTDKKSSKEDTGNYNNGFKNSENKEKGNAYSSDKNIN